MVTGGRGLGLAEDEDAAVDDACGDRRLEGFVADAACVGDGSACVGRADAAVGTDALGFAVVAADRGVATGAAADISRRGDWSVDWAVDWLTGRLID